MLGPSGSGKSTLLRAVAGLEPDATGQRAVGRRRPRRRAAAPARVRPHVPGPRAVPAPRRARQRRVRAAHAAPARAPRSTPRARDALALVGLAGFEHRRVAELSGGEQQRVALARALAPAPRLLMLDEPLGALDRALRERLVAELRALFVRLGLTILFVTHDHDEAFALADRVVVMHEGRIEQVGQPGRRSGSDPANAFVAEFLGWNVTRAFGDGLVAVRPDGLASRGLRSPATGDPPAVVDRPRRSAATTSSSRSRVDAGGQRRRAGGGAASRRRRRPTSEPPVTLAPELGAVGRRLEPGPRRRRCGSRICTESPHLRHDTSQTLSLSCDLRCPLRLLRSRRARSWWSRTKPPIAEAVATRLRSEGFAVAIAADGPSGRRALPSALQPDLVVLDLMLPGLDGLDVCREIQRDRPVPVLMLTARDSETDLVVGLAVGADDYLTKPFSARELVARVHALLRRVERRPGARRRGRVALGAVAHRSRRRAACSHGDELVHLTPTEFDLLAYLAERPGAGLHPRAAARRGVGLPRRRRRAHRRLARARAAPQARQRRRAHRARRRLRGGEESDVVNRRERLAHPLDDVPSIKLKLGFVIAAAVAVTVFVFWVRHQDRRVAVGQRHHRRRRRDGAWCGSSRGA